MRAVFSIDLPRIADDYPLDSEIRKELREHGWEFVGTRLLDDDQQVDAYQQLAGTLFKQMPEIRAGEEAGYVIYYGELPDERTKFSVTRRVEGQITFRLLHENLARLERSTETMIKKLMNTTVGDKRLSVSNNLIVVYERGHEDVIIEGTVIPRPIREAMRADRRDVLLVGGSIILLFPVTLGLFQISPLESRLIGGTLERLSTALITTIIVSGLGFFQTYYEIMREKTVKWEPYSV